MSLAWKYRIVPTSSPWVSEDDASHEFRSGFADSSTSTMITKKTRLSVKRSLMIFWVLSIVQVEEKSAPPNFLETLRQKQATCCWRNASKLNTRRGKWRLENDDSFSHANTLRLLCLGQSICYMLCVPDCSQLKCMTLYRERELTQATTATTTHRNAVKRKDLMSKTVAVHVHFFAVLCTTTTWNDQGLGILKNVNHSG